MGLAFDGISCIAAFAVLLYLAQGGGDVEGLKTFFYCKILARRGLNLLLLHSFLPRPLTGAANEGFRARARWPRPPAAAFIAAAPQMILRPERHRRQRTTAYRPASPQPPPRPSSSGGARTQRRSCARSRREPRGLPHSETCSCGRDRHRKSPAWSATRGSHLRRSHRRGVTCQSAVWARLWA